MTAEHENQDMKKALIEVSKEITTIEQNVYSFLKGYTELYGYNRETPADFHNKTLISQKSTQPNISNNIIVAPTSTDADDDIDDKLLKKNAAISSTQTAVAPLPEQQSEKRETFDIETLSSLLVGEFILEKTKQNVKNKKNNNIEQICSQEIDKISAYQKAYIALKKQQRQTEQKIISNTEKIERLRPELPQDQEKQTKISLEYQKQLKLIERNTFKWHSVHEILANAITYRNDIISDNRATLISLAQATKEENYLFNCYNESCANSETKDKQFIECNNVYIFVFMIN